MISEERIVEWLFTPLETCISCSSFGKVETQERKTHCLWCSRRGGSRQLSRWISQAGDPIRGVREASLEKGSDWCMKDADE